MSKPFAETDNVEELVKRVQALLPGWTVDSVFAFGSTARDEAVSRSDIDLWVLVHSDAQILLDKTLKESRYTSSLEQFQLDYTSFEWVEVDTWGDIISKINPKRPLDVSCPLADTRWFLWQLATEADWQTFLYTVFARPLVDPYNFLGRLQQFLWENLPFHIHPDHGIVRTLKHLCEGEKLSLLRDVTLLVEQGVMERHETSRPLWLQFAVECIRDSIVLLTLVQRGKPVFLRREVLQIVATEFEEYLLFAERVYWYKCTEEGRGAFDALLAQGGVSEITMLRQLTGDIVELWHRIMTRVDQVIIRGEAKLGFRDQAWYAENVTKYNSFFADYLRSRRHDQLRDCLPTGSLL